MTHENLIKARDAICERQEETHPNCRECPLDDHSCNDFEDMIEIIRQAVKDDPSLIGSENAK